MLKREVEQRGFGAIQVLLVLIVVCVIASAVWLTYSHYQTAHQAKPTSNAASSALANSTTTKTRATTQQPTANQNVVKIPELGIQMTVPNDIKDLTYQVSTVMLRNGKQATLAMFSTKALTVLDSNQAD